MSMRTLLPNNHNPDARFLDDRSREIAGLVFECVSLRYPEAYDIYSAGIKIGSLRLRYGELTLCNAKDRIVWWAPTESEGEFMFESERRRCLNQAAGVISSYTGLFTALRDRETEYSQAWRVKWE